MTINDNLLRITTNNAVCSRCGSALPEAANFCPVCGRAVVISKSPKKRGNGQGSVYKLKNGTYLAIVTAGYYLDENGKRHRRTRSKVFKKKSDAVAALQDLKSGSTRKKREKAGITFRQLYDAWLPTHRAGKSTIDCYKAAFRWFSDVADLPIAEIDVDDLQECLDACPHGKRTRQNMKAVCGLVYKYGIPRHMIPDNLNLATFLVVEGEDAAHRASFTDVEIEKIKKACGVIPQADLIYMMIYLGFRPTEFLQLRREDYFEDAAGGYFIAGGKTEAGKGRTVPVSAKIRPFLAHYLSREGYLYPRDEKSDTAWKLRDFSEYVFYPTLEAIGIENPIVEAGGGTTRHKYSPHSCRHTFATLLKRTAGPDKDKMELIGHASPEMLRYYQDVNVGDLRRIIDAI